MDLLTVTLKVDFSPTVKKGVKIQSSHSSVIQIMHPQKVLIHVSRLFPHGLTGENYLLLVEFLHCQGSFKL